MRIKTKVCVLCQLKHNYTKGVESCTKAKPLFCPVCLSLIRRTLLVDRLAKGAKTFRIPSTVDAEAMFLRMIAVESRSFKSMLHVSENYHVLDSLSPVISPAC